MNQPTIRTPEQLAQIKRLALPIAVGALIMAAAGLVLLLNAGVDHSHPPSIFGVNLSFCAMLVAIGILLWAKGARTVPWAMRMAVLALLAGAVGPFIFFKKGIDLRIAMEHRELANVYAIASAARTYAQDHDGIYPPSLDLLLDQHGLTPDQLHSPYSSTQTIDQLKALSQGKLSSADYQRWFARHSDYDYLASDLRIPVASTSPAGSTSAPATAPNPAAAAAIIVACGHEPIMRTRLSISFLDGSAQLASLEQAEDLVRASNQARAALGLPIQLPPESIRRAHEAATQESPPQH